MLPIRRSLPFMPSHYNVYIVDQFVILHASVQFLLNASDSCAIDFIKFTYFPRNKSCLHVVFFLSFFSSPLPDVEFAFFWA